MGLSSLTAALAGLRISQQQINVISTNVANVGTPGFTRKILPQSSQAIAGVTVGVSGETIIRNVDLNLSRDLWTQISATSDLDVKKSFLERIQQFHGPPDVEISVAAEISKLGDAFAALSDVPEDRFLQSAAVNQAQDAASRINDLADLITTLRNDAQDEISSTVTRVNDLLIQIADLNKQVQAGVNQGQTVAQAQDERDNAIEELAGLIDISFFQRGDGVLVIQTNEGVQLADQNPEFLTFDSLPVGPTTFYPDSAAGVFLGDPLTNPAAVDLTARNVGGRLGGLLELRDEIFPQQSAQLDELAHKMALRFEAQGLRLFTNDAGIVPADVPPDPSAGPPAVAVPYVGFAAQMQVNATILADNSLIQQGTTGTVIGPGSNVVISRVVENVFGDVDFQIAEGAYDINLVSGNGTTLQSFLGIFSENRIESTSDLTAFVSIADIVTAANGALDDPNDQFEIIFEESRLGLGPTSVLVDLSDADLVVGTDAADKLATYINAQIAATFTPVEAAAYNASVSVGLSGQLIFDTQASFSIDSTTLPTGIGQAGLTFLGLTDNAGAPFPPTDPYFDIQVGSNEAVRITIEPGDTEAELLTKLQAVPGLAIEDFTTSVDGILRLRPGNDFLNPEFGGDIRITAGPFQSLGAGANSLPFPLGPGTIPDGLNVVSALFGSFSAGPPLQDQSPIRDVGYQYETFVGSGVFVPFREDFLGPGVNISTDLVGADKIVDFGQKMITQQTQELNVVNNRLQDEETLRIILRDQLVNSSGVNLDEELANLIVQQTAFNASARVVSAVDELFQTLLNAV